MSLETARKLRASMGGRAEEVRVTAHTLMRAFGTAALTFRMIYLRHFHNPTHSTHMSAVHLTQAFERRQHGQYVAASSTIHRPHDVP